MTATLPMRTGSLLFVLPKSVYITDDRLIHSHNYAQTGCFVGPLRVGAIFLPSSLHSMREWCPTCFPGKRCSTRRCRVPSGGAGKCPVCLRREIDADKAIARADS
jgi:hypothetical protein